MSATARFIVGDALTVLRGMEAGSVDCIITSPPYPWQRSYLPPDHPDKALELGQESTPGEALASLLRVMEECWRVLSDDGTYWINLGDVHAGSGGSGGDYNEGGLREGQARWQGTAKVAKGNGSHSPWRGRREGWPLDQSVCWIPGLFGASLAYGRNLLTGEPCQQWVTRPAVTWCKPSPPVGELRRRFRSATELIIYGGKHQHHYFDLDAVRVPHKDPSDALTPRLRGRPNYGHPGFHTEGETVVSNPLGAPPLNWWVVSHPGFAASHFATFPPELIIRPVIAGCPEGGTILDPFVGSGTTLAVAHGHGRSSIGVDLDERNAELARQRVGMFLEVEGEPQPRAVEDVAVGESRRNFLRDEGGRDDVRWTTRDLVP